MVTGVTEEVTVEKSYDFYWGCSVAWQPNKFLPNFLLRRLPLPMMAVNGGINVYSRAAMLQHNYVCTYAAHNKIVQRFSFRLLFFVFAPTSMEARAETQLSTVDLSIPTYRILFIH